LPRLHVCRLKGKTKARLIAELIKQGGHVWDVCRGPRTVFLPTCVSTLEALSLDGFDAHCPPPHRRALQLRECIMQPH
jgi:hypothetical protein